VASTRAPSPVDVALHLGAELPGLDDSDDAAVAPHRSRCDPQVALVTGHGRQCCLLAANGSICLLGGEQPGVLRLGPHDAAVPGHPSPCGIGLTRCGQEVVVATGLDTVRPAAGLVQEQPVLPVVRLATEDHDGHDTEEDQDDGQNSDVRRGQPEPNAVDHQRSGSKAYPTPRTVRM
jgi:hypothetical protein